MGVSVCFVQADIVVVLEQDRLYSQLVQEFKVGWGEGGAHLLGLDTAPPVNQFLLLCVCTSDGSYA